MTPISHFNEMNSPIWLSVKNIERYIAGFLSQYHSCSGEPKNGKLKRNQFIEFGSGVHTIEVLTIITGKKHTSCDFNEDFDVSVTEKDENSKVENIIENEHVSHVHMGQKLFRRISECLSKSLVKYIRTRKNTWNLWKIQVNALRKHNLFTYVLCPI